MQRDLKADAHKLRELDKEMQMSFSGPLVSDAGVGKVLGVLAWAPQSSEPAGGVLAELWGLRL